MAHPLVDQLRFTRSEFVRGLGEVQDPQAQQRQGSLNCISWIVGHLAWQEQRYWLQRAQGRILFPELNDLLAYGKPACTPPAAEMWALWRQVIAAADPWLDAQSTEGLQAPLVEGFASVETFLYRVIFHYWYHLGEAMAVRQTLGHTGLPDFVGNIDSMAPYRPDSAPDAPGIDKAWFLQNVRQARARWEALLESLPEERWVAPGASGSWSLKDIVAHLSWHEREMLGVLQSRVFEGSDLWLLPLEQRNQAIYALYRDQPLAEVRAAAQETHQQLLVELEKLEEADLHDPARFEEMPADWIPWDILADNTFRHYTDHRLALEDWLKAQPQA